MSTAQVLSPGTSRRLETSRKQLCFRFPVAKASRHCLASTATMTSSVTIRAYSSAQPMMCPSSTPRSPVVLLGSRTLSTRPTQRMARRQHQTAPGYSLVSQVMPSVEPHPLVSSRHRIRLRTRLETKLSSMRRRRISVDALARVTSPSRTSARIHLEQTKLPR